MVGKTLSPEFWKDRSVFLTGHTGFKGSWLVTLLEALGANVTGYSLAPPENRPSLYRMAALDNHCQSHLGDIRDLEGLKSSIEQAKPSVVFHLAAQALVRPSYLDPLETFSTNMMGTVNLLESCRNQASIEGIVVVTSDKCYENREWVWGYRENEAMGGHDPYSSSKGCAELVTSAYRRSFFSGPDHPFVASARAGNVIGGGDYALDRLVPDLLSAFQANKPAEIRNPRATRPWQHVLEPLGGYICLAEQLVQKGSPFASGWNFGPNPESIKTVGEVADLLCNKWGSAAHWRLAEGAQPHEAQSLSLDCSKAHFLLNWRPKLTLDHCLDWIVTWTKNVQLGFDPYTLCADQVRQYLAV